LKLHLLLVGRLLISSSRLETTWKLLKATSISPQIPPKKPPTPNQIPLFFSNPISHSLSNKLPNTPPRRTRDLINLFQMRFNLFLPAFLSFKAKKS
jgi:hypothetical protein